MCISCPEPHYKPRHSIPRCKIRQKIREISHFPQFIMVSALKLLIINSLAQSQRYRAVCFTRLISIRPIRAKVPSPGHYPGLQRLNPYALKGQKLLAQGITLGYNGLKPYALKGQKLLAQGTTLGYNGLKPVALKGQKLSLNTNF